MPAPLPVMIIGAGAAGLRAAQVLTAAGVTTTILEARPYVGGRIHSQQHGRAWVELGANWLHGYHQHPLKKSVAAAGLRTLFTNYDEAHTLPGVGHTAEWHRLLKQATRRSFKHPKDAPLADFFTGIPPHLQPLVAMEAEMYYGASLTKLSGWNFDEGGEPDGADFMVLGGWEHWVTQQTAGLTIRLNTIVTAMEATAEGFLIHTAQQEKIAARAILNTMPLGVLQQPAVQATCLPGMPARHRVALQRLGMGNLEKLFFTAPIPCWPRHAVIIANSPTLPLWYDLTTPLGQPILMALVGMSTLSTLPPQPTAAAWEALAQPVLRQFCPTGPLPELLAFSRWHADPFSHGSYSYYAVGSSPADRTALQQPWHHGRYLLAGEHTDTTFPANVQGAWQSGERAAQKLLPALAT